MDFINNRLYINAVYDKYFQSIKTDKKIFSIQKHDNRYFVVDVYGKRDHEFNLTNEVDFDFNQKHFCRVELVNSKNNYVSIELNIINEVKIGIDKLYLQSNKDKNEDMFMMNLMDGTNAILLAITKVSDKKEKIAIIDPKTGVGHYVEEVIENNEKTNFIRRRYLSIKNKIAKFDTDDYCFVLFAGNISIKPEVQYVTATDYYAIESFTKDITNYVNLWNKYNDKEKELTFQSLKNQEAIVFSSYNIDKALVVYFDEDNFTKFRSVKNDVLLIGNLQIKNLFKIASFNDYITLENDLVNQEAITYATVEYVMEHDKAAILNVRNMSVFSNLKTDYGYIACSLQGSATMFKRRENAKKKIVTPDPGHLNLRTLFTDDPVPNTAKEEIAINYNLVKDLSLTENQKEAIEIICNTPDIAIIQGPPGTGKTTVINQAIIQINEHAKGQTKRSANNLVSGFRHETVVNLTDKVRLYGLPAVKIGDKMNESDALEPKIDKYIDELNDRLDEKYHDLMVEDKDFDEFGKLYSNYSLFYNSIDSAIDLLSKIKSLEMFKYNSSVCRKLDELIRKLEKTDVEHNFDKASFLDLLYELPLYEEAYKDNEQDLQVKLELMQETTDAELKKDIKAIIEILSSKPLNIKLIKNKRRDLIIKYRNVPQIFTSTYQKKEIIDFLDNLYETSKIDRLKRYDGEKLAILDYKESLHENPFLVRQTLLEYTKVLGATNQQSISRNMSEANYSDEKGIGFDNVFIDEAATSSPLDLFIPMTLAKSRLVLVGDHKQLPHIINEKITDEIEESLKRENKNTDGIQDEFKTTLFEYLIDKAHILEKKDGKKRVITLNNQFRMHPELGNLVSKYFYMDEGGLNSPRPASDFTHNYHNLKNQYLYWIDNKDKNKHSDGSRYNLNEAELIAKHIKEAIEQGTYHYEPLAIITFYRAQVDKLKEACIKYGLYDAEGKPVDKLDLSIGTVDAFQGREFKVVYLATTYSIGERDMNPFEKCRLNDNNLLCVALSRQENLLIVVGNKDDYRHENAKKYVPSLYEVNRICNGG